MRITKLINKGRRFWSSTKFSQLFLKEMYAGQSGEFVCGSWGLKGYSPLCFNGDETVLLHFSVPRLLSPVFSPPKKATCPKFWFDLKTYSVISCTYWSQLDCGTWDRQNPHWKNTATDLVQYHDTNSSLLLKRTAATKWRTRIRKTVTFLA